METLDNYRAIIERVLSEYAKIPFSQAGVQAQTVFDRQNDHYLLMLIGREGVKRVVHGCLVHLDIIQGQTTGLRCRT